MNKHSEHFVSDVVFQQWISSHCVGVGRIKVKGKTKYTSMWDTGAYSLTSDSPARDTIHEVEVDLIRNHGGDWKRMDED